MQIGPSRKTKIISPDMADGRGDEAQEEKCLRSPEN